MTRADLSRLASFLEELREASIHFTVRSVRPQAIMVNVSVPGERWEVEFLDDGSIEVERFVTTGSLSDASALPDLFRRFSDTRNGS
jgi:hypothetical protein